MEFFFLVQDLCIQWVFQIFVAIQFSIKLLVCDFKASLYTDKLPNDNITIYYL